MLRDQFNEDLKTAMKEKAPLRLSVLRMVKAAVKNREIEAGHELNDEEVIKILGTQVKQRRDSAEQYQKGNRPELAEKELQEIAIIETYMPRSATLSEIDAAIDTAIRETNASSPRDVGIVMKAAMRELSGKTADGRAVNQRVREKLGQ